MKLRDNRVLRLVVGLSLAVWLSGVTLLVAPHSSAQSQGSPAQGLQVNPVISDLNVEPGKTYTLRISVTNVTAQELLIKPAINDFRAKDETGNPEILVDGTGDASYSFRRWASIGGNFTIKPKESRTVQVFVNVPSNAEAGGHYGVIRFSAVPADAPDSNVNISASIGTLVLARVAGQIEENLEVKEIFVERNGKKGGIFESSPHLLVERLENTGNVHVRPQGTVIIKNGFGKTVLSTEINKQKGSVLPKSVRRFEQAIDKKLSMGKYTVELNATYGSQGGVVISSATFWVIPFKLIIVCLLLLILFVFLLRKGVQRYNRRIISKHQQHKHR